MLLLLTIIVIALASYSVYSIVNYKMAEAAIHAEYETKLNIELDKRTADIKDEMYDQIYREIYLDETKLEAVSELVDDMMHTYPQLIGYYTRLYQPEGQIEKTHTTLVYGTTRDKSWRELNASGSVTIVRSIIEVSGITNFLRQEDVMFIEYDSKEHTYVQDMLVSDRYRAVAVGIYIQGRYLIGYHVLMFDTECSEPNLQVEDSYATLNAISNIVKQKR